MKKSLYIVLTVFCILPIKGQELKEPITFDVEIVNDVEGEDIGYVHNLYCKNSPQVKVTMDSESVSFGCNRGDTVVLEVMEAAPFRYRVEFVATDTTKKYIHVWTYPNSCKGWDLSADNHAATQINVSESGTDCLTGTYAAYEDDVPHTMMQLKPDGTFEYIGNIFNLDREGGDYYTGRWILKGDTLVCKVLADVFPETKQCRYPGQTLYFVYPAWEENKREAAERDLIFEFVKHNAGLKDINRKIQFEKVRHKASGL